jgi:hypothetical protein
MEVYITLGGNSFLSLGARPTPKRPLHHQECNQFRFKTYEIAKVPNIWCSYYFQVLSGVGGTISRATVVAEVDLYSTYAYVFVLKSFTII